MPQQFPALTALRARSMLFTLYGDYAYPRGQGIRLSALVRLAAGLAIGEAAVRSAVARLARQGWIAARRGAGRSHYELSDAGRKLIDEGTARIYGTRNPAWDGSWCLLVYSIPEAQRKMRDRVRNQLAWLGFGSIGGGAYVSPRKVEEPALALVGRHEVADFARVFSARLNGPGDDRELARRCWPLDTIARRYEEFREHYAPLYERDVARSKLRRLEDARAFVHSFSLTHDFRRFPFIDPGLPPALLPPHWPGKRATELFDRYHALLKDAALRHFDAIVNGAG
jgi:phenylacetic acid degradation operon negative regulatory protein